MIGISIDLVTPHNFLFGDDIVWTKYSLSYTDFNSGGMTVVRTLFAVQPNQVIHAIIVKPQVTFAAPGITNATVSIGLSGFSTKYTQAFSLMTVGAAISQDAFGLWKESFVTSQNVQMTFGMNVNSNTLTAGAFDVWVYTSTLP